MNTEQDCAEIEATTSRCGVVDVLKRLVEHEFEHYLEWPTADKSAVTTVSAKLFAEHVSRLWAQRVAGTSKMFSAVQGEPVAYVLFADNGNIRIWCADPIQAKTLIQEYGDQVRPLYAAPQPAEQQPAPDVAGLVGYQAELKEKINAVSRRSLDGSVVMNSEEWNGIVELVEKLLTAAPHPEAAQGGGVPVPSFWASEAQETEQLIDGRPRKLWWECRPGVGTPYYTHPHNGEQGGERCSWWKDAEDWDGNNWESDCGAYWTFIDEGPAQNEMHYCPKCGRKLSQLPQPPKSKEDRGHE